VPADALVVQFDRATQSIGALREAAYRLIPQASCVIGSETDKYVCRLDPKPGIGQPIEPSSLRQHFIDLVTDENLREKVSTETSHVRDVILALAFGALANPQSGS
jgi:His-Xaa-Ser system protein HxsD